MTESEWLTCSDAPKLTKFLPQPLSRRKCVLAVCGYGRRIESCIPAQEAIDYLRDCEREADQNLFRPMTSDERMHQLSRVTQFSTRFGTNTPEAEICHAMYACLYTASGERPYLGPGVYERWRTAATNLAYPDSGNRFGNMPSSSEEWLTFYQDEMIAQADIVRDLFGNPFRPVTADPAWLTSTAVALARGIYDERAFDRLPILADALQDAGCENTDVLDHCRGPGPHARGCWVVDLVLGKS